MLELLIVAFLIVLNAFFAMSEMALMTSRKLRLKQMAEDNRGARCALALAEHPDNLLSTVQVGITAITVLTGFYGGESLGAIISANLRDVAWVQEHAGKIGTAVAVVLITAASVVFGELVPKRLALTNPEKIASMVAIPIDWVSRGARPLVATLSATNRLVLRLLGIKDDARGAITEEEIQLLVSESHEQGVIDADERNMMTRVMRLGDRTAESLMTPRMRIAWLDAAADREENLQTMRETPYSRYPVYRGNDADVIGVLEVKTLLDELAKTEPELFRDIRPAVFVSESTHALKLLEIFREEQQSIALVVDEYGEIQGMVTVTDVMGAILGRLQSMQSDETDAMVARRDDGSLLVDGALPIEDVRELLGGIALPDSEALDYHTAAGMAIAHFGRIPNVGEYFDWDGWRIEVVDLDGPRVDKLLLQPLDPDADDE
ncbi:putative transmembrane CorC/HlyC family transporter [Lysobacter dokdonensis DS-58]|uniref:Putative transmembrane CorC/HlyC family transporter n=1 Tax=Lysobacter dokdonensis DS-58 TaxID=1300345 RepID=A0A0A2WII4_9GAMM|nr:hemolysin family protein [Lysobacter dokdonensis]KGQ18522.1 putative transmembrane CorC/HlyC family transporter [Lysobacter dokdonensis DS-58]